jgi:hypothetical protein
MDLGDDAAGGNGSNWDHLSWQAAAAVGRRRRCRQRRRNAVRTVGFELVMHSGGHRRRGAVLPPAITLTLECFLFCYHH